MSKRTPNVQPSPPWTPPQGFEEYRVLSPLSRGGMGEVYLGHDTLLDRPVAIKFISSINEETSTAQIREQILNEARAAARLQHPNVVTIYRVSEIDGHPMIISEFVRGQNLDALKKPLEWQRVLDIGLGVARGLGAAHRRGVLHLDIKPGNVIVQGDGEVKLLDFGLAKLLDLGFALGGLPLGSDEIQRSSAATPEVLAPTMNFSSDQVNAIFGSAPAANLAHGVVKDEQARQLAEGAVRVAGQRPLDAAATPRQANAQPRGTQAQKTASSSDVARVARSDNSGAVTTEMQKVRISGPAEGASEQLEELSEMQWELPRMSSANRIAGTPLYMAPEIWRGEPGTRRADIYSAGALLYELCTGSPPFHGTSMQDLPATVSQRDVPPLYSVAPAIEPRLAAIIDRCLKRDPALRYSSGDELRDALEQLQPKTASADLPLGNPYRGLLAFESEHRGLFFGRRGEIGTLLERLRSDPFVLVVADSGIGKSSLCRAGVLPHALDGALAGGRSWQVRSLVPGKRPLQALCAQLADLVDQPEDALQERLRKDPMDLARLLHRQLGADRGVVLFIDQLEEIVTIAQADESQIVSQALGSLCARLPSTRMLMTVRSDFLARVATMPGLGDELVRGLYLLRPLSKERIKEAIIGPALTKGVQFESETMVDALANETASAEGGLPLLQFALAELWEVRQGTAITQAALDGIGGVSGALARHADQVMGRMGDDQRREARRILMALVTLEDTRTRRSDEELVRSPAARVALDALVAARLLVAKDTGEGVSYEVAHEALLKGWGSLRKWLDEHRESRAVRLRLEQAATEWWRLGQRREALWSQTQLAESQVLEAADIGQREARFLEASRRSVDRQRFRRRAMALLVPCLMGLLYVSYRFKLSRDLTQRVMQQLQEGERVLADAQKRANDLQALRQAAYDDFDHQKRDDGEAKWAQAQERTNEIDEAFARACQILEATLTLDATNRQVKARLADALLERALQAERDRNPSRVKDLQARLALYDDTGLKGKRFTEPAHIKITTSPAGVTVKLAKYIESSRKKFELANQRTIGKTPIGEISIEQGSNLLIFELDNDHTIRYPFVSNHGTNESINLIIPHITQIPNDYTYIPPGKFYFGSADDDALRRGFLSTVPLHEITTDGYLIGKHEVTFENWIEYLRSIPADEKERRRPKTQQGITSVELAEETDGRWSLSIRPVEKLYKSYSNEPIIYTSRKHNSRINWLKMPVVGISYDDALAYVNWLHHSARVPHARLCTEIEWERAARGADTRIFSHGNSLSPLDANYDETYSKSADAAGIDEVGSYPISVSPFGLFDMVGNVFEWVVPTLQQGEFLIRGGAYFFSEPTQRVSNRNVLGPNFRDVSLGLRVCASLKLRS